MRNLQFLIPVINNHLLDIKHLLRYVKITHKLARTLKKFLPGKEFIPEEIKTFKLLIGKSRSQDNTVNILLKKY